MLEEGGNQDQRADLIGKWLVLRERWPEITQFVQLDPDKMKGLEDAADNTATDALQNHLRECGIGELDDVKNLSELLRMEPHFEDLNELTFFSETPAERGNKSVPAGI